MNYRKIKYKDMMSMVSAGYVKSPEGDELSVIDTFECKNVLSKGRTHSDPTWEIVKKSLDKKERPSESKRRYYKTQLSTEAISLAQKLFQRVKAW